MMSEWGDELMDEAKRYLLITCEVLFREVCLCASQSKNIIDIVFVPQGLHNIGAYNMSKRLQSEIDKADKTKYETILLGYGLCNNGIIGLHSKLQLVVPRAHDCITLLLGSRNRYNEYFEKNSGTFYESTGWMERGADPNNTEESVTVQLGINKTYQEYVELYGEENAKFLLETLGDWLRNYKKYTFIDTGIGNFENYKKTIEEKANTT